MNYFGLLKKSSAEGLVGLYLKPDGIGYAQIQQSSKQGLEILGCDFLNFDQSNLQQEALQGLVSACQATGSPCIAALSPEYVSLTHMESPKVDPSEYIEAIRWQLRDKIDFDPQLAVVDYFNMPGTKQSISHSIYAVAVNEQVIKEKVALIKPSGLKLQQIDITELALKHFAIHLDAEDHGLAVVHLFKQQGLLQIVHNRLLVMTRRLGIGLDAFQLNPNDEVDPERQKSRVMDKLVLEIQRSLDYYESHFKKAPIQSVALPPLEHRLPTLTSYISTQLALHAWTIDINSQFHCQNEIAEPIQIECIPAIGTALSYFQDSAP